MQKLVGLPEYGVTLTGTVKNATILNNSGKTIIVHVLRFDYAGGGGIYMRKLKTRGMRLRLGASPEGILPSATESPMSTQT